MDQGVKLESRQEDDPAEPLSCARMMAISSTASDGSCTGSGTTRSAAKNLERAVVLRPEDPTINDHLGDAYWRVGRKFEARFQWKRALSLDPEKEMIPQIEEKLRDGLKRQR